MTSEEDTGEEPEAQIRALLEENLNRFAWSYVAKTAHEIEAEATAMSSHCADAGRDAMEQLMSYGSAVNPIHVYH